LASRSKGTGHKRLQKTGQLWKFQAMFFLLGFTRANSASAKPRETGTLSNAVGHLVEAPLGKVWVSN
jgi:hypothetical protein